MKKIHLNYHSLHQRGRIIAGLAAVRVVLASGPSLSQPGQAFQPSRTDGHAGGPWPKVVLVHGAWANSASWNGVVERLQRAGYTVDVPPNPLQGLAYDPAYLADFLHSIAGPIVLVGSLLRWGRHHQRRHR